MKELARPGAPSAHRRFDAYLCTDWCAGAKGLCLADGWFHEGTLSTQGIETEHPATRIEAERQVGERLERHRAAGRRVLLGLGTTLFWERRESRGEPHPLLRGAWPEVSTEAHARLVERSLQRQGLQPFPLWQALARDGKSPLRPVGLPLVARLWARSELGVRLWPFETGLACPNRSEEAATVVVEIWAGAIAVDPLVHADSNAAELISWVLWAASADAEGTLRTYFKLPQLQGDERTQVLEEGWILGHMPLRPARS